MEYFDVNALNDRRSLGVIIKAIEGLIETVMGRKNKK